MFVRYWAGHDYHEWLHNAADIDGARVVMALDLGPEENESAGAVLSRASCLASGAGRDSSEADALSGSRGDTCDTARSNNAGPNK